MPLDHETSGTYRRPRCPPRTGWAGGEARGAARCSGRVEVDAGACGKTPPHGLGGGVEPLLQDSPRRLGVLGGLGGEG